MPKGFPDVPGVRRLAIQVEDHDLTFGEFEGAIPSGEYGAGNISIWDRGTYDLREWSDDSIIFTLHGKRLKGTYNLVRFRRKGDREWLLFVSGDK